MWSAEQWHRQQEKLAESRAKKRRVAERIAARAYHTGKRIPMPEHTPDCPRWNHELCTCGAAVDTARPGKAADAPIRAQAAHILAHKLQMAEQNARKRVIGLTPSQEARLPKAAFTIDNLPKPDLGEEAIVPEIVSLLATEPKVTPGCRACEGGDAPCRNERGTIRSGHALNPSGLCGPPRLPPGGAIAVTPTKQAAEMLQAAAPLAAERLIEGVRSENEWVASACARVVIERTVPAEVLLDQNAGGPILVFPPGTKVAVGIQVLGSAPPPGPGEDERQDG